MDAVEFVKQFRRFCIGKDCEGCELYSLNKMECALTSSAKDCLDAESIVLLVEQWSQAHPQKTIMQDFFEKFPNAPKSKLNHPTLCPGNCGYNNETPSYEICKQFNKDCVKCWSRPLED